MGTQTRGPWGAARALSCDAGLHVISCWRHRRPRSAHLRSSPLLSAETQWKLPFCKLLHFRRSSPERLHVMVVIWKMSFKQQIISVFPPRVQATKRSGPVLCDASLAPRISTVLHSSGGAILSSNVSPFILTVFSGCSTFPGLSHPGAPASPASCRSGLPCKEQP